VKQSVKDDGHKRVFDLVKDFGTSESPKSTRSSTAIMAPAALRPLPCATPRWFAAQDNSHKWLDAAFGCSLCFRSGALRARQVNSRGYRGLPAVASLSLAGSGGWCAWKRANRAELANFWAEGRNRRVSSTAHCQEVRISRVIFNGLLERCSAGEIFGPAVAIAAGAEGVCTSRLPPSDHAKYDDRSISWLTNE